MKVCYVYRFYMKLIQVLASDRVTLLWGAPERPSLVYLAMILVTAFEKRLQISCLFSLVQALALGREGRGARAS